MTDSEKERPKPLIKNLNISIDWTKKLRHEKKTQINFYHSWMTRINTYQYNIILALSVQHHNTIWSIKNYASLPIKFKRKPILSLGSPFGCPNLCSIGVGSQTHHHDSGHTWIVRHLSYKIHNTYHHDYEGLGLLWIFDHYTCNENLWRSLFSRLSS